MKRRVIESLALTIILCLGVFIKSTSSYFFNTDYTRDLYRVLNLVQGHPALIGPPLSVGIFSTPYYYYFILPFFTLSGFNPYAFLIFNSALFILFTGVLVFIFTRKENAVPILGLILSPFFLITARGASNAYLFLPFLLIYLYLVFFFRIRTVLNTVLIAILAALIINFHPVALIAVFPTSIYLLMHLQKKRLFFLYLGIILLSFAPLVLFEAKHDFVITKSLISGSYKNFIRNTIPRTFFENIGFILGQLRNLLGITPFFYLFATPILFFTYKLKNLWGLYFSSLFSFLATLLLMRFQFEPHYLFPACTLLVFSMMVTLSQVRHRWLTLVWLALLIPSFPLYLYRPSGRPIQKYSVAAKYAIDHDLVSKTDRFNVLGIIDSTNKVVNGNEYRFFLAREGYKPLNEWEYSDSNTLLVFSEDRNYDLSRFNTWETGQFGQEYFADAQKYDSGDILIYRVTK